MDLHEIFTRDSTRASTRGRIWPSLGVIEIDVHYHLEVTVSQQCHHFGRVSIVAQTRSQVTLKSYVFCLMTPSLMTLEHVSRSNH